MNSAVLRPRNIGTDKPIKDQLKRYKLIAKADILGEHIVSAMIKNKNKEAK
jgi:hypothetical protein